MLNRKRFSLATLACVGLAIAISTPAAAWDRGSVTNFLLPSGAPRTGGLTVDSSGNVYAATFSEGSQTPAQLFTFNPQGTVVNQVTIQNASNEALGLAFRPGTNELLVVDFAKEQVLSVNPNTGQSAVCITGPEPVPNGTYPVAGLNGITVDAAGNIYVSDSNEGIIWCFSPAESGANCGQATAWSNPGTANTVLKSPSGVVGPFFGASGIAFNKAQNVLHVCNTAMGWIARIAVDASDRNNPIVLTRGINGCNGIATDSSDNTWAAASLGDEIVVVDTTGKAIAKLGDFNGVVGGATRGLLYPGSLAFSPDGQSLWVNNLERIPGILASPVDVEQTVNSQAAEEVTTHSIAKLPVPTTFPAF
jgi:sugar lactone lactonase YvrE